MANHSHVYSAVFLSLAVAAPAFAAEPVSLQNDSLHSIPGNIELLFPGDKPKLAGSADTMQFLKQHRDINKVMHIRMQQQYAGFPVFGGYVVLHTRQPHNMLLHNKSEVLLNGKVYKALEKDLGKPQADFKKNASRALEQLKAKYPNQAISEEEAIPMVYIDEDDRAHWAYKVSALVRYPDKIPERPTMIMDASTLTPFVEWNDIKTAYTEVRGRGFGGNTSSRKVQYGRKNVPYLIIHRDNEAGICAMENDSVRVVDMKHKVYGKNVPMKFSCQKGNLKSKIFWTGYNANGYDRANGAFSPSNDALYAGQVINQLYNQWYGIPPLVNNAGKAMKMIMRVHYGRSYENAFWDGKQMTFGDGGRLLHPLVSLGIGAHEISHGFTEQYSNLMYYGQSGGMNESFSDMAAKAAEFFAQGKNDWKIGGEIFKKKSGYDAIRYMDKPSRDGESIDSADEYYKGLDVHYSSGVYNRLFYLLATTPNWNTRKAFDVMVKANMDYWTPYSTFVQGGCGIISATQDLGYEVHDVKNALAKVAVDYQNCNESQTLMG